LGWRFESDRLPTGLGAKNLPSVDATSIPELLRVRGEVLI
jgi:hypothetical protein